MSFVLADQRYEDVTQAFRNYEAYLAKNKNQFPPQLFKILNSDWYFNFNDHRCPHDAWLKQLNILEREDKSVEIQITLLGAYHDMELEFIYEKVVDYDLKGWGLKTGHHDWLYDEFRISERGKILHEIEWCNGNDTGHFLIEAENIKFESKPLSI